MWTHSCVYVLSKLCADLQLITSALSQNKEVQTQTFIQTGAQVAQVSLAGSTAYWCEVSVRDGWIKQQLFATLIPWFPHNVFLPVSTFHNSFCRKWQSRWDTFIDLLFYSSSVVSLDVLDSPSLPFSWVQTWRTFHLVYSKECSNPFSVATVRYVFFYFQCHAYKKVWLSAAVFLSFHHLSNYILSIHLSINFFIFDYYCSGPVGTDWFCSRFGGNQFQFMVAADWVEHHAYRWVTN